MPIREFTDSRGVAWKVWSTVPSKAMPLSPDLRAGWLSFDSGSERRRVCPVPKDWDRMPADRLELLCRVAATERKSDPKGIAVIRNGESDEDSE